VATGKVAAKGGKYLFDAAKNEENQEMVNFSSILKLESYFRKLTST
jgi:hypothetical protein